MADLIDRLLRGDVALVCQTASGELTADAVRPTALLSGSFNPLHDGHLRLADVASARLQRPVAFEMGLVNADKAALSAAELRHRLPQFMGRRDVWLTREPTFLDKSRLFPGAIFVVGQDTAERVVEPRFYGSQEGALIALQAFRQHGCRFLVAGRVCTDGQFRTAEAVSVPAEFRDLFDGLSEAEFRSDISSTTIRGAKP